MDLEFETLRVESVTDETSELVRLRLTAPSPQWQAVFRVPGQYVAVRLRAEDRPAWFAIASAVGCASPEILVRRGSSRADALAATRPGDVVELSRPTGKGFAVERGEGRDCWLVAMGSGMAALRPVVQWLLADRGRGSRVHLLLGARSEESIPFREDLDAWAAAGVDVHTVLSRIPESPAGKRRYVQHVLDEMGHDLSKSVLFACGSKEMLEELREVSTRAGLASDLFLTNY